METGPWGGFPWYMMDVKTFMGTNGGLGMGYGHLLENPVLFLLCSSQAKLEFSMLLSRMGDLERCIVMEAYRGAAAQIDDGRAVAIELDGPGPGPPYQRQLAAAVRRTKRHTYCRGKDLTVCAVLEGSGDYSREYAVCRRLYGDLKNAYRNHVYFDFYVMASEPLVPGAGLGNPILLNALKSFEGEEWTRYIFLVSDMTNEERIVEQYSERFETVLDSIVLTNCRSESGSGAYIHERLLEESAELGSKVLALGRVRMALDEAAAKRIIRHEMLERVLNSPARPENMGGRLNLDGLGFDILQDVKSTYPGILKAGLYEGAEPETAAQYTNQEAVSRYFRIGAEAYMRLRQEQLREKFKKYMERYCRREITAWLMDALFQPDSGIVQKDCCRATFQKAAGEIQKYRELAQRAAEENEQDYAQWKNARVKTSRWARWVLRNRRYGQYRVLKEWAEFRGRKMAGAVFEQCLQDMEQYAKNWAYRMEGRCELFSLFCLSAREDLEELAADCCGAERHLIQGYREAAARELAGMEAEIRYICGILNGLLREDVDAEYIDRAIGRCVDWLYVRRLKDIMLCCGPDSGAFGELLANFKDHICLLTRTQIPNASPYVFLMGHPGDAFLEYVHGQRDAQYIIYDTEYMGCPAAFYYQHLCQRGLGALPDGGKIE